MSEPIVIVVDLDAAGAPPAADSLRQLLALVDSLPDEGGELDWRLVSVSLNSPLRAELKAFAPTGEEASEHEVAKAAEGAFAVLDATNDNEPGAAVQKLSEEQRRHLKSLLAPMKDRQGSFQITVPGRSQRVVRSDAAARTLAVISQPNPRRPPELGSVEGEILAATTHYGAPALRVRSFLTDQEVICVFDRAVAREVGAAHTLDEVWSGKRVVVTGRVVFDGNGRPQTVHADIVGGLTVMEAPTALASVWAAMKAGQEDAIAERWGGDLG